MANKYVANPAGYTQLQWVDGDRRNNAASNLKWVPAPAITTADCSLQALKGVDVQTLGKWNKIAYEYIKTQQKVALEHLCYEGDFHRYLYLALFHHGVPAKSVPIYMRLGFELFKRKLQHYYFFSPGQAGENKLRKYCYICFLAPACHSLDLPFAPRLRTQQLTTPEVFDYL